MNEFNDWDSVEAAPEYALLKGDFKMALEKINQEPIKSGINAGKPRHKGQFTITDDSHTRRKIFMGFMDDNEISRQQVKALALATNTPLVGTMYQVLTNSIGKDFIANVGIRKDKSGEYPDQNTIWSFKPLPVAQYQPPQPAYAPAPVPPVQRQRPANAQLGSDGVTWWIPNPNSPSGWDIWQ
jgi:hypothetical protein